MELNTPDTSAHLITWRSFSSGANCDACRTSRRVADLPAQCTKTQSWWRTARRLDQWTPRRWGPAWHCIDISSRWTRYCFQSQSDRTPRRWQKVQQCSRLLKNQHCADCNLQNEHHWPWTVADKHNKPRRARNCFEIEWPEPCYAVDLLWRKRATLKCPFAPRLSWKSPNCWPSAKYDRCTDWVPVGTLQS